ncbi:MAG TPA: CBS domain-containing protein [Polyangia bacterium]
MNCQDIMKRDVVTATENQTIQEVAQVMATRNIGFVPVCDGEGRPIGTVTDRDMTVRAVAQGKSPSSCRIAEVMTRETILCRADSDVASAEKLMIEHHKSRIMIADGGGKLIGIISLSDLATRDPGRRAAVVLREVATREAH